MYDVSGTGIYSSIPFSHSRRAVTLSVLLATSRASLIDSALLLTIARPNGTVYMRGLPVTQAGRDRVGIDQERLMMICCFVGGGAAWQLDMRVLGGDPRRRLGVKIL